MTYRGNLSNRNEPISQGLLCLSMVIVHVRRVHTVTIGANSSRMEINEIVGIDRSSRLLFRNIHSITDDYKLKDWSLSYYSVICQLKRCPIIDSLSKDLINAFFRIDKLLNLEMIDHYISLDSVLPYNNIQRLHNH